MIQLVSHKPLVIPQSKKFKGLFVACGKCRSNVSDTCKELNKSIHKCPHPDRHYFKAVVSVAGTTNERKTKNLKTRDYDEAVKETIDFSREVKENRKGGHKKNDIKEIIRTKEQGKPNLLVHSMARYIGWLNNEEVPAHLKKERSKEHIKDVERAFKLFVICLRERGYNLESFTMDEINDNIVGLIFSHLEIKEQSNRTFNKVFSFLTSWFKWYSDEYNQPMRNWFEKVKRKKLNPKPQSITKNEFDALLKQITPENGVRYYDGVKVKRTFYRDWLKDAFLIALLTGRRREEISNLTWNLVDMKQGIITIEDFKVNRIQKRVSNDEKKLIYIPITQELEDLLHQLGYEEKKDTNQYLLANEVKISRKKVMGDILSRGFSHYYNQLKTGRKLTFKSLRKTYITSLQIQMGANTKMITGHSDNGVIEGNYIDKIKIAKAARNTSVFQEESEREIELNQLRKASKSKQQNKDLNI